MRRLDHDDPYTSAQPGRSIAGPLFDAGPYDHSPLGQASSKDEAIVAGIVWKHKGRHLAVSIAHICANTDLSPREVKSIVAALRTDHHMPIGARREEPAGYFWIVDAADREAAVTTYRAQILTMWGTLRRLDSPQKLRELRDKMTVEDPATL